MNTQPKHKDSPNSTLDWIESDVPVPGYKPAHKYPGWHWKQKDAAQVLPVVTPEPVKVDTLPSLPYPVKLYQEEAAVMHAQLATANGVMIDKVNCIRLTDNPEWYREMYKHGYTSKKTVLSVLKKIATGIIDLSQKYQHHLIVLIEKRLEELAQSYPEFATQLYGQQPAYSGD